MWGFHLTGAKAAKKTDAGRCYLTYSYVSLFRGEHAGSLQFSPCHSGGACFGISTSPPGLLWTAHLSRTLWIPFQSLSCDVACRHANFVAYSYPFTFFDLCLKWCLFRHVPAFSPFPTKFFTPCL